jgi:phage shock protein E
MKSGSQLLPAALIVAASAVAPARAAADETRTDAAQAGALLQAGALFVDVRTDEEWADGHLKAALHLPVGQVGDKAASVLPDKARHVVTYCRSGARAQKAAEILRGLGYTRVTVMTGGYEDLKAAGYPVAP